MEQEVCLFYSLINIRKSIPAPKEENTPEKPKSVKISSTPKYNLVERQKINLDIGMSLSLIPSDYLQVCVNTEITHSLAQIGLEIAEFGLKTLPRVQASLDRMGGGNGKVEVKQPEYVLDQRIFKLSLHKLRFIVSVNP